MHQMIELHPKADALDTLGLPSIPYPVALPAFQAAVANDGELPLTDMLHGLQLRAAAVGDWERLEPAMARLAELLAADDARETVHARGEDWWLEVGPVPPGAEVIILRRGESLLAAVTDRGDGRLRVATWHPMDARTIELLLGLACVPQAAAGGEARSSWACAVDAASGPLQAVADGEDQTRLAHLYHGADDSVVPGVRAAMEQPARRPATVAAEIATWQAFQD